MRESPHRSVFTPPIPAPDDQQSSQLERGRALEQAGDLSGAVECYRALLAEDPACFRAYNNLANVFASLADWNSALLFYRAALELAPNVAQIHHNLANVLLAQGETGSAIQGYRRAIALAPAIPSYYTYLGDALRQDGQYEQADQALRTAIAIDPDHAEAYVNLGVLYNELQQEERIEALYRKAIALKPGLAQAHVNLGYLLLKRGAFAEGWAEQEWRWQWKGFPSPRRNFAQPLWRGEPLRGRRLFLHAEQGLGDAIQFLRYVPLLVGRGATVLLEVHPELRSLAAQIDGVAALSSRGEPAPEFDLHCPLLSLPLALGTTLDTIPAAVPYLRSLSDARAGGCTRVWVDAEDCSRPRNGSPDDCQLRVGLVWAGSPTHLGDRQRSLPLANLAPLSQVQGASLFSLQRGPASSELQASGLGFAGGLPRSGDFSVTAAAVAELDLVIAADTAVAHLAGAMGKPVWVLVPALSDWRWLVEREDSPWYATARLFRQKTPGSWEAVVSRVASELSLAVEARHRVP